MAVVVMAGLPGTAAGEEQEGRVAPNLEVIQHLTRTITSRVLGSSELRQSSAICVTVLPKEAAWYVEGVVVDEVRRREHVLSPPDSSRYSLDLGLSDVKVSYGNLRRDGFLGTRLLDRTVRVRLATKLVDMESDAVLFVSDVEETVTDTIALSSVPDVENPVLPVTRGRVPAESFMSGVGEPLIIIGSMAVAVVLLFTVRS